MNRTLALQEVKSRDMVPFSAPVQSKAGAEFRLVINPNAACHSSCLGNL